VKSAQAFSEALIFLREEERKERKWM
jgi:hypothetical protein